jgi:hypothetical protein
MAKREISEVLLNEFSETLTDPMIQECFSGVCASILEQEDDDVPDEKKDEPCFLVLLSKKLPERVNLPETYSDIPVRSVVVGASTVY